MLGNVLVKNRWQKKKYLDEEYRGSNFFPVTDYDEEYKTFIGNDGYASIIWECEPLYGCDEKVQERLTRLLNTDFPNKSFIQITMFRSPDVYRNIGQMLALRNIEREQNALLDAMIKSRAEMLEMGTFKPPVEGLNFKYFDLRITITLKIPISTYKEGMREFGSGNKDAFKIQAYSQRFESTLKSERFNPRRLDRKGYIRLMSAMVNWGENASWRKGGVSDDPNEPINEQILDYDTEILPHEDMLQLGKCYAKSYSAKRLPAAQYLGDAMEMIGDLNGTNSGIHHHYAVTINVYYPDRQSLKDSVEANRQWTINQAKPSVVKLAPVLGDKKDGFDLMHESMKEANRPVKMSFNCTVFAPDEEKIIDAGEQVDGFFKSLKFRLLEDKYSTAPMIINHLPGGACPKGISELKRYFTLTSEHVAVLAPLFGEWKGTGTPHSVLTSRNGQVMSFSMDDTAINMNMLIAATSGGGKSFFTNDLIVSYLSCGYRVWTIDVGRSYEKLCRALDQNFISFESNSKICLNPFPLVVSLDGTEKTRSKMLPDWQKKAIESEELDDYGEEDAIIGMLSAMASPGEKLPQFELVGLRRALETVWMKHDRNTTVRLIRDELLKHSDQRITDLGAQLYAYAEGSSSKYFEGENTLNLNAMLTCLELEELKGRQDLQAVVLFQLIYQIQQEVYLGDRSPSLVVIDEAWDLLKNGGEAIRTFLEHAYRRFRKYNARVMMCTQLLDDMEGETGEAILNNSATKLLFRHTPEAVDGAKKKELISLPGAGFDLLRSVHTQERLYYEVMITSERGIGVGRLFVPNFQKILYSSAANDVEDVKKYTKMGMDMTQAIKAVLKDRAA